MLSKDISFWCLLNKAQNQKLSAEFASIVVVAVARKKFPNMNAVLKEQFFKGLPSGKMFHFIHEFKGEEKSSLSEHFSNIWSPDKKRMRELLHTLFVPACEAMGFTPNVVTRMYLETYQLESSRSVLENLDKEFDSLPPEVQKVVTPTRLKAKEVRSSCSPF